MERLYDSLVPVPDSLADPLADLVDPSPLAADSFPSEVPAPLASSVVSWLRSLPLADAEHVSWGVSKGPGSKRLSLKAHLQSSGFSAAELTPLKEVLQSWVSGLLALRVAGAEADVDVFTQVPAEVDVDVFTQVPADVDVEVPQVPADETTPPPFAPPAEVPSAPCAGPPVGLEDEKFVKSPSVAAQAQVFGLASASERAALVADRAAFDAWFAPFCAGSPLSGSDVFDLWTLESQLAVVASEHAAKTRALALASAAACRKLSLEETSQKASALSATVSEARAALSAESLGAKVSEARAKLSESLGVLEEFAAGASSEEERCVFATRADAVRSQMAEGSAWSVSKLSEVRALAEAALADAEAARASHASQEGAAQAFRAWIPRASEKRVVVPKPSKTKKPSKPSKPSKKAPKRSKRSTRSKSADAEEEPEKVAHANAPVPLRAGAALAVSPEVWPAMKTALDALPTPACELGPSNAKMVDCDCRDCRKKAEGSAAHQHIDHGQGPAITMRVAWLNADGTFSAGNVREWTARCNPYGEPVGPLILGKSSGGIKRARLPGFEGPSKQYKSGIADLALAVFGEKGLHPDFGTDQSVPSGLGPKEAEEVLRARGREEGHPFHFFVLHANVYKTSRGRNAEGRLEIRETGEYDPAHTTLVLVPRSCFAEDMESPEGVFPGVLRYQGVYFGNRDRVGGEFCELLFGKLGKDPEPSGKVAQDGRVLYKSLWAPWPPAFVGKPPKGSCKASCVSWLASQDGHPTKQSLTRRTKEELEALVEYVAEHHEFPLVESESESESESEASGEEDAEAEAGPSSPKRLRFA